MYHARTLQLVLFKPTKRQDDKGPHNSPIFDEYQTQSAEVLGLPWKWAHQDDSNDTPQPIRECQVDFPLHCGLRLIMVYPNPQYREVDLTLTYRLWGIVWIILFSPFSWQCQNLCLLSLVFITDWRVVGSFQRLRVPLTFPTCFL